MIKQGDKLRIKLEWQDAGDDAIAFVAVDDEEKGRVTIEAQVDMRIKPTQVVKVEMVEKVIG